MSWSMQSTSVCLCSYNWYIPLTLGEVIYELVFLIFLAGWLCLLTMLASLSYRVPSQVKEGNFQATRLLGILQSQGIPLLVWDLSVPLRIMIFIPSKTLPNWFMTWRYKDFFFNLGSFFFCKEKDTSVCYRYILFLSFVWQHYLYLWLAYCFWF